MKAVNIEWDVENQVDLKSLPTEVEIPKEIEDLEGISNFLSDVTGFSHKGYQLADATIPIQIEKIPWDAGCDISEPHNAMSVQIEFSHEDNDFDETEFSISSYDKEELSDLFEAFCGENGFVNVSVNCLAIVRVAPTIEDLIEMESSASFVKNSLDDQIQSAATRATESKPTSSAKVREPEPEI